MVRQHFLDGWSGGGREGQESIRGLVDSAEHGCLASTILSRSATPILTAALRSGRVH